MCTGYPGDEGRCFLDSTCGFYEGCLAVVRSKFRAAGLWYSGPAETVTEIPPGLYGPLTLLGVELPAGDFGGPSRGLVQWQEPASGWGTLVPDWPAVRPAEPAPAQGLPPFQDRRGAQPSRLSHRGKVWKEKGEWRWQCLEDFGGCRAGGYSSWELAFAHAQLHCWRENGSRMMTR